MAQETVFIFFYPTQYQRYRYRRQVKLAIFVNRSQCFVIGTGRWYLSPINTCKISHTNPLLQDIM